MNILAVVNGILQSDTAVAALVGTRIRPLVANQDELDPHIVMTVVTDLPETSLDGYTSGLRHARVQIDCYSRKYDEAHEVADAVETLLQAYKTVSVASVVLPRRDLYEDETQYHRVQMDVSLWLTQE